MSLMNNITGTVEHVSNESWREQSMLMKVCVDYVRSTLDKTIPKGNYVKFINCDSNTSTGYINEDYLSDAGNFQKSCSCIKEGFSVISVST